MSSTATTRNVGEIRRTAVNDFVSRHVDIMREAQAQEQELNHNPPRLEKIGEMSGEDDDRSHSSTADASTSASSIESYADDTSGGGNSSSAAAVRISNFRKKQLSKLRPTEHRVQVMNDMSSVSSYELDESMSMDLSSKGTGFSEWDNDSLGNILSTGPPASAKPAMMMMRRSGSPGSMGVEAPPKPMSAVTPAVASTIGPPVNPRNRHTELALRIQEALTKFDHVSDRVNDNMDTSNSSPASNQQRRTIQVANVHSLYAKEAAADYNAANHNGGHRHEKRSQRQSSFAVPNPDNFANAHRSTAVVAPDAQSSAAPHHHHRHQQDSQQSKEPVGLQLVDTSSSATHSSSSCTMGVSNHFERQYSDLDDDTVKAKVEDDESQVAWRWPILICCFACLMFVIVILVAAIVAVTVVQVGKHNKASATYSAPVQSPISAPVMIPVQQPVSAPVEPQQPVAVTPVAPVRSPIAAPVAPVQSPTEPVAAPVLAPALKRPHAAAAVVTHTNGTKHNHTISSNMTVAARPVQSPVQLPTNFVPTVLAPSLAVAIPNIIERPTVNETVNTTRGNNNAHFTVTLTNSSHSTTFNGTKSNSSSMTGSKPSGGRRYRRLRA